jgi:hypothetical protein
MVRGLGFAWFLLAAQLTCLALAEDVRYVTEGGVTYQEIRQKVKRPVQEARFEERERIVYQEEVASQTRDVEQVVLMPVTEYRWEAYWAGRWNPFAPPYLAYRLVPYTRYERRTQIVRVPTASRTLIPQKRVEKVPIVTRRMVEEEVVRRIVVSGPRGGQTDPFHDNNATSVARRNEPNSQRPAANPGPKPSANSRYGTPARP